MERWEYALYLIDKGYTAKEITELCGYKGQGAVWKLAKDHGKTIKSAYADKHKAMREYKSQGHTMSEVAEKFNVNKKTAQRICKGIAPQKAKPCNKGTFQDIEKVKQIIIERAPGFEYAGKYTGSNGSVDLKCKKCGSIHTHNWHSIRIKGAKFCDECAKLEAQQRKEQAKAEKEEKRYKAECDKRGQAVVKLLKRVEKLHCCPVCGKVTDNNKYCSMKCCQKANEVLKDARRRKRVEHALVDKDISLEKLYKRDKGICHICGSKCDWSDHHYRGRYFIVGKEYPSIDHVIPLAKGGEHSWENVKLAHFSCNSAKGASLVG